MNESLAVELDEIDVGRPATVFGVPTAVGESKRTEQAVRELLASLGVDLSSDDLADTPRRVAAMFQELLSPQPFNFTTFENSDD